MADIFCLIILENGSRRKLKLQTGAYDELLESLAGLVDGDLNSTLVQIFDTDIDDFVDFLPGDIVPNKAKLCVIQKTTPVRCPSAANALHSSPSTQSALKIVSASSMAAVCEFVEQESPQPSIIPHSTSSLEVSVGTSGGEALLDAPDAGDHMGIDFVTGASEQMAGDELHEHENTGTMVANDEHGEIDAAAKRLSQIPDVLRAMLPRCSNDEGMENGVCEMDILPAKEYDVKDYLKFTLPSFGKWCDIILRRRSPLNTRIKRHIINTLFKACFKITLYPTRRLYRTAIESLVVKYPHLITGPCDFQRWCFALKSKFKNTRKRFPGPSLTLDEVEGSGSPSEGCRKVGRKRTLADVKQTLSAKRAWLNDIDEVLNPHAMPACSSELVDPGDSVATPFQAGSGQENKVEEFYNCPDISDAVLVMGDDDSAVVDMLKVCTDESAGEKFAEKTVIKLVPGRRKSGSTSLTETSSKKVPDFSPEEIPKAPASVDYLKFKLPPFTAIRAALDAKEPVTGRICRHIINSLYSVCRKITLYPSSCLYRYAVDCLVTKYPHLIGSDDETARQLWVGRLRAKFKNIRRQLPKDVLNTYDVGDKRSYSNARRTAQKNTDEKTDTEAIRRISRTVYLDRKLLAMTSQQSGLDIASAAVDSDFSELSRLLKLKRKYEQVKDMPVEQAIVAFPCYRQESSLLAEFKALWKVDIAECFEKGIQQLFLVLMNSGTPEEIMAISEAEGDILLVVLDAIAKRCKERMSALLTEDAALPAPCLVKRSNGSFEMFVNSYFLFTASSLLGGICALFACFWMLHIEYPKEARSILTFLEHAFLNLNYTKPQLKVWGLINLYRDSNPLLQEEK